MATEHAQALLRSFIQMYSSRVLEPISRYRAGKPAVALLAEVGERVVPDMELREMSLDELTSELDTTKITVRLMLRQFYSLDPTRECVLGIRLASGDVLTEVVRLKRAS